MSSVATAGTLGTASAVAQENEFARAEGVESNGAFSVQGTTARALHQIIGATAGASVALCAESPIARSNAAASSMRATLFDSVDAYAKKSGKHIPSNNEGLDLVDIVLDKTTPLNVRANALALLKEAQNHGAMDEKDDKLLTAYAKESGRHILPNPPGFTHLEVDLIGIAGDYTAPPSVRVVAARVLNLNVNMCSGYDHARSAVVHMVGRFDYSQVIMLRAYAEVSGKHILPNHRGLDLVGIAGDYTAPPKVRDVAAKLLEDARLLSSQLHHALRMPEFEGKILADYTKKTGKHIGAHGFDLRGIADDPTAPPQVRQAARALTNFSGNMLAANITARTAHQM